MRFSPSLLSSFKIPLSENPWTAQEFHKFRSLIGKNIIEQKDASEVTKPDFQEKWDKMRGFYLKKEPFYIPTKEMIPWPKALWNFGQIANLTLRHGQNIFTLHKMFPSIFEVVSENLSTKNYSKLKERCTPSLFAQIVPILDNLSPENLQLLNLKKEDLFSSTELQTAEQNKANSNQSFYSGASHFPIEVYVRYEDYLVPFGDVSIAAVAIYKQEIVTQNWPNLPENYGYILPRIVYANYHFTRMIELTIDTDWILKDLNYMVL